MTKKQLPVSEEERQFILELNYLTRKHRIHISGCGCCGSPSLEKLEKEPGPRDGYACNGGADLIWVGEADVYTKDDMHKVIV